jgi:RNA polymerase sigma factor (sigma-70 family)
MNKCNQLSGWWDESRQGNVTSFGYIHQQLYPALFHYLLKIMRDEDVCQDILQDLFIKMWERKEIFGPICNVKVYFFKSARSMALNYVKSCKSHDSLTNDHQHFDIVFSQEEVMVNFENNSEVNRLLSLALNTLPGRQREMIFLKYFDGWNYDQIAEVTGIKYQSVVNHVHRAIIQLRAELITDRHLRNCRMAV